MKLWKSSHIHNKANRQTSFSTQNNENYAILPFSTDSESLRGWKNEKLVNLQLKDSINQFWMSRMNPRSRNLNKRSSILIIFKNKIRDEKMMEVRREFWDFRKHFLVFCYVKLWIVGYRSWWWYSTFPIRIVVHRNSRKSTNLDFLEFRMIFRLSNRFRKFIQNSTLLDLERQIHYHFYSQFHQISIIL